MAHTTDFLVVGSGAAGLCFALKAAAHGRVTLVTKGIVEDGNTRYAQGGIAAVIDANDSYAQHIDDTLECGAGICNEDVVRMVVEQAPALIHQLVEWGAAFDRMPDGSFDLAREGGHSQHRILHHKDASGAEIERALAAAARRHTNITILEHHFAIDLITQHHLGHAVRRYHSGIECYGAYILNIVKQRIETYLAKTTIIATGGAANAYHTTTNPTGATGDGIAMVYRAKGVVENMAYVQFHPTALYAASERPSFLITEAMRGYGGILRTPDGNDFMPKYDARGSLAPRDIVARAIDSEMKHRGCDHVYLDITHKAADATQAHFPNIYEKCLKIGIDIAREMIPVAPAAHFLCGGIRVDAHGQSSIARLYAIGEASCTGLHGANRLASNSLLEAVVYADRAASHAAAALSASPLRTDIPDWNNDGTTCPEELVLITQNYKEVQQIMSYYVGIVRSNLRLERAFKRLRIIYSETEELYRRSTISQPLCELRNTIQIGYLIIKEAMSMRQSRGLHYSVDYPPTNT